jgi:hypothetical protein
VIIFFFDISCLGVDYVEAMEHFAQNGVDLCSGYLIGYILVLTLNEFQKLLIFNASNKTDLDNFKFLKVCF